MCNIICLESSIDKIIMVVLNVVCMTQYKRLGYSCKIFWKYEISVTTFRRKNKAITQHDTVIYTYTYINARQPNTSKYQGL